MLNHIKILLIYLFTCLPLYAVSLDNQELCIRGGTGRNLIEFISEVVVTYDVKSLKLCNINFNQHTVSCFNEQSLNNIEKLCLSSVHFENDSFTSFVNGNWSNLSEFITLDTPLTKRQVNEFKNKFGGRILETFYSYRLGSDVYIGYRALLEPH